MPVQRYLIGTALAGLAMRMAFAAKLKSIQLDVHTALDARPRHQPLVPTLDIGKIGELHLVARVPPGPTENREVGDRQRTRDELPPLEPPVEHAVEPAGLGHVARQAVAAVLLVLQRNEMMHLSRHRAEPAHLPHQPFIDRDALNQWFWQEFSGLLAEIEQDRAGFENADALAVRPFRIDDCRNLVVRTDRQE